MNEELTLGEWLREARMAKDITLRALAIKLDITPSYLSDIENDRRIPAEDVMKTMTDALGIDFEEAMARAGRIGEQAERYMKKRPEAVKLFRRISEANLSNDTLREIRTNVERLSEDDDKNVGR